MKLKNFKIDKWLLIIVILFSIISTLTIGSAQILINRTDLMTKQIMWY